MFKGGVVDALPNIYTIRGCDMTAYGTGMECKGMSVIIQRLLLLLGIVLDIIGLGGVIDDITTWGEWWAEYHQFASNPVVLVGLFFVGNWLIAHAWSQSLLQNRLEKAGGLTGRELPAHLENWDQVKNFTVWQVAWLWNDLEPQRSEQGISEGTPAYPTFRRLKEHLDGGLIEGSNKKEGSWVWTNVSRQQLIDYALSIGQRPKFLFPEERFPFAFKAVRQFGRNEVPYLEAKTYQKMSDLEFSLFGHLLKENPNITGNDIWPTIKFWIESGQFEAVARREVGGLLFHYEKIPQWKWEHMQRNFTEIRWAYETYKDVRVRQKTSVSEGHLQQESA